MAPQVQEAVLPALQALIHHHLYLPLVVRTAQTREVARRPHNRLPGRLHRRYLGRRIQAHSQVVHRRA